MKYTGYKYKKKQRKNFFQKKVFCICFLCIFASLKIFYYGYTYYTCCGYSYSE